VARNDERHPTDPSVDRGAGAESPPNNAKNSPEPEVVVVHDVGTSTPHPEPVSSKVDDDMPLTMPGAPDEAKQDLRRIGVEGEPANPSAGPALIRLEVLGFALILALVGIAAGLWLGWIVATLMIAWLLLAVACNPSLWAGVARMKDRRKAVHLERERRSRLQKGRPSHRTAEHL